MRNIRRGLGLGALLALVGCAGNPLVGSWTTSFSAGAAGMGTGTLNLQNNGTVNLTASVSNCAGQLQWTGTTWSSTSSTLTIGGTPTCSGSITCTAGGATATVDCSMISSPVATGDSAYTLSNNNNTLTIGTTAFTRQ